MNKEKRERTSRRMFVKEIAGAAVAGAFVSAPCVCHAFAVSAQDAAGTGTKKAVAGGGEKLVAPCGLYCGACPMYLATQENSEKRLDSLMQQFSAGKMQMKREDLLCDGCIGGGRVASFCRRCAMRSCAEGKSNVTRCSDCPDFPCTKVTSFNNDGMRTIRRCWRTSVTCGKWESANGPNTRKTVGAALSAKKNCRGTTKPALNAARSGRTNCFL